MVSRLVGLGLVGLGLGLGLNIGLGLELGLGYMRRDGDWRVYIGIRTSSVQ